MKKVILFSLFIIVIAFGASFLRFEKQASLPPMHKSQTFFSGRYFYPIELISNEHDIPYLEASIEGVSFLANLDTGFNGMLSLSSEVLKRLQNKTKAKPRIFYGIRGKQYRSKTYKLLSPLCIENVRFSGIVAKEINLDFERDLVIGDISQDERPPATIGWRSLVGMNLFLELSKPRMVFCDGLNTLQEQGFLVDGAIVTDLLLDRDLLEFKMDTPSGPLRCLFDTGSSFNIRHKATDLSVEEPTFFHIDFEKELPPIDVSIQGKVVGPISFYEAELPCGIEAIVGMDFLNEHCIFLDFVNEKIYFLPPQPSGEEVTQLISSTEDEE